MNSYDVVIVGSGLGGSAVGGYLANAGRKVLVLERLTEFADWVRRERLRRLRFTASFATTLFSRFGAEDVERRGRAFKRMDADPALGVLLLAAQAGREALPAECFTEQFYEKVFGATAYVIA